MKMKQKRIMSLFLAMLMLFSVLQAGSITAGASGGVKSKLDSFISTYPSGSRWTGTFDGGIQCFGFAKMVVYNVFGKEGNSYRHWNYSGGSLIGMTVVGSITSFSSANVKSLLSNAKCGDVLQFNTTKQHSMIVYSVDSSGVTVYDCNWDNNCGISKRYCNFGAWSGRNSSKLTLLRSSNYSSIDGPDVNHTVDTKYGKNFTAYLKNPSGQTPVYDANHNLVSGRYISGNDPCTIHEVYTDGCCKVSYITDSGVTRTYYTKYSYFKKAQNRNTIIHTWISDSEYGSVPNSLVVKNKYWFCYELKDSNTGDLYNTYSDSSYSVKLTIYNPDGSVAFSDTCSNSDKNRIGHPVQNIGTYRGVLELSGDISGKSEITFTVVSNAKINFEKSSVDLNIPNSTSATIKTWIDGNYPEGAHLDCSYDSNIISVTSSGKNLTFTANKVGTANYILYLKDKNGNTITSATCKVTVTATLYTITYDANGGSPTFQDITESDGSFIFTNRQPARTGYTFLGWNSVKDAIKPLNSILVPGKKMNTTQAITFYAVWQPNTYSVKYNANGGTGTTVSSSHVYDTEKSLTANGFTRTGYTFAGWSTSSLATATQYADKESVKNLTSTNGATVNLYARWKPNEYYIYYNSNGGTGTMANSYHYYDTAKSLSVNKFTRDGYTFLGWSKSSTATTPTYTDGQSVKNLISTAGGVTLYAVWEKNPATVSSISVNTKPNKMIYTAGETFSSSGLSVKANMSDGTSKVITSGFTVSSPDMSTAGTKAVIVTYEGRTTSFNVTVNAPSISISSSSKTMMIGDTVVLTATTNPSGQSINWVSSDTSVVTVSNGVVTAKASGLAVITAKFTYNGKIYSNTCVITVMKTLTSISISSNPTKLTYEIGESLNTSGLKLKLNYSDGSNEIISSGFTTSGFNSSIVGTKTVTVNYEGFTTSFIVSVECTHKVTTIKHPATTSKNGSVVTKCSVCGNVSENTVIYYPKTITLSATSYVYDGKVKKPAVTVKDSKGNKIAASNYTVTYASGRKNVGQYSVKITFKGNYSGSKTLYFTINPKATTLSSVTAKSKGFTVKWKKQATQTTGYEIQYATDSKFTKNKKTVTISKNSTTSKTISKLSAKKKYYVRIRTYKTVKVNGKSTKIYSSWSKAKTVTTKK